MSEASLLSGGLSTSMAFQEVLFVMDGIYQAPLSKLCVGYFLDGKFIRVGTSVQRVQGFVKLCKSRCATILFGFNGIQTFLVSIELLEY